MLVLAVVNALPDTSMTVALMRGGREFFQWGGDRYLAAHTFDALNTNTAATGMWKKPPKIDPYPVPGSKQAKPATAKPISVKDLYSLGWSTLK